MIIEKEIDNDTFELLINPKLISIKKNNIVEIIGYNNFPEEFEKLLDDIIGELKKKFQIKTGYKIFDYKPARSEDGIIISDIFFKTDRIVKSQLNNIEKVAIFVLTIGREIENWIKELNDKGEILLSYLVDITASEAAENVADLLHDYLKEKMKNQGLNVTNRYSPGYCNWSVSEQHKLFSLLPENFCGIKLTDSALMIPIKSISGIIGIGKNAKWKEYLCDKCGVKDCTYRIKMKAKKKIT
ncbi:MAG: vitamin B12 dependent-methionine synthase activation domain-containing protein [Melioribacter sp.]|uniref:vitamin B12 dependent-methionine synthase activation domain-containing protein n=1 Tax=Rosettibacter primus TaxID=3111523 RepID=UPI00247C33AF|nr:vitamin B12 dependent-methionine synthase activation domain-containing protein [Melioribacter sp.]